MTTIRYQCLNCGDRFEHEEADKPRCPGCMRRTNIEPLGEKTEGSEERAWIKPAIVVGLIAAVVAGYLLWRKQATPTVTGEAPVAVLEESELRGYLRAAGADGSLAAMMTAGDAVTALSTSASGSSSEDKARALVAAIRERAQASAFVRWSMTEPRDTAMKSADEVARALQEDDGRARLYPLEIAALVTAALRERAVPAMVAEVWEFEGDRAPPDPSGKLGYFAVAVYPQEVGQGDPVILDPYLGRSTSPTPDGHRILSDAQVVSAAYSINALHQLVHENDPSKALEQVDKARRLDPRSPYMRSVRGAIMIVAGGLDEGMQELEAAAQIRPDPARRNNTAGLFMAMGNMDSAAREVSAALEAAPDFAAAHATLGAIYAAQREYELARTQLSEAERLDPGLSMLPLLWAEYHARNGDLDQAAERASQAVERQPYSWKTRVGAAQIYRAASRYDDMRRQARAAIELVPESQREALRGQLIEVLGDTVFEDPDEDLDAVDEDDDELDDFGEEDDAVAAGGDFQLGGGGDFQLGGGGGDDEGGLLGGDSLGGGGAAGGDGPALMLGDPGNFNLGGGGGGGLQLNLNE